MAIDEPTRRFLARFPEPDGRTLDEIPIAEHRERSRAVSAMSGAGPEMARVEDHRVRGDAAEVPVRLLVPPGPVRALIVYLHGGGWVVGGVEQSDTLARELAARAACAVLVVDYRLAPEHPFPGAVDDAWAATRWAHDHLERLLGARRPLVVAGDSAGGNLAAVVARRARDEDLALALQVLVYPVIAPDFDTPTYLDPENQLFLTSDGMRWFWDQYAPGSEQRVTPAASPLAARDLSGLAPAVVLVAEHDVLRHEGEQYAAALRAAGVPVVERLFEGQMHLFFSLVNVLPASVEALDLVAAEIARVTPNPDRK